jgi:hypothetical protein
MMGNLLRPANYCAVLWAPSPALGKPVILFPVDVVVRSVEQLHGTVKAAGPIARQIDVRTEIGVLAVPDRGLDDLIPVLAGGIGARQLVSPAAAKQSANKVSLFPETGAELRRAAPPLAYARGSVPSPSREHRARLPNRSSIPRQPKPETGRLTGSGGLRYPN